METQEEPVASTSAAAPSSENSLKRKDRDEEEEEGEEQHDDDEKEDPSFNGDVDSTVAPRAPLPPAKKKTKKEKNPLVKKVAVWKDIQEWKEGDDPLGRFPIEVLDMIISIDSDLDLRDHLALAGTCRYFRSCYRDVVFQVLYHAKNPNSRLPAHMLRIGDDGSCGNDEYYGRNPQMSIPFEGPVRRGWNVARKIFSSGSFSQDGWGVSNEEWESDGKLKQDEERRELSRVLKEDREGRRVAFRVETEQEEAQSLAHWTRRKEEWDATVLAQAQTRIDAGLAPSPPYYPRNPVSAEDLEKRVQGKIDSMIFTQSRVYGSWLEPDLPQSLADASEKPIRDPWESAWRGVLSTAVNKPKISRSDAKALYKVSDRELLTLPLVKLYDWKPGAPKHFRRTSVEALALRSHGGVGGHDEYLEKLRVRKEKAHDTRVKNGTLQVAKPKPPKTSRGRIFW